MMRTGCRLIMAVVWAVMGMQSAWAAATNRYVVKDNPGALPPYDALTNAAADIQTAINAAIAANGDQVLVSAGTYDVGGTVATYGYASVTNRVRISKAITVRSINNDPASTIIQGAWDPVSTNGWGVVRCVYMVANSSLIGFTLTNGATLSTNEVPNVGALCKLQYGDAMGGGVLAADNSARISNCVITKCIAFGDHWNGWAGGGAYQGTFYNCLFTGNSTPYAGGGGAQSAVLSNCTLVGNSTTENGGGALKCTLYGCVVSNNAATNGWGGGAYMGNVYNCAVIANKARYGGGVSSAVVSNCTISFNVANTDNGSGGGVRSCDVFNSLICSNTSPANDWGSGAAVSTLSNCVVTGDGILYGSSYNCLFAGCGKLFYGSSATVFRNCTFANNTARPYGDSASRIQMVNCISWSNAAPDVWVVATNSCGIADPANNYATSAAGNITNNPRFMVDGIGYGATAVLGNYRLQAGSPCVGKGLNQDWMANARDLDGLPRISPKVGGTVDMGAYEFAIQSGTIFSVR